MAVSTICQIRSVFGQQLWARRNFADLFVVIRKLNGSLCGKKVAILGYAFKKDTADTRESQAAEAIRLLQHENPLEIAIYDPQCAKEVIEGELNQPGLRSAINVCDSPAEACDRASAVLILTDWDQFSFPSKSPKEGASKQEFISQGTLLPEPECARECKDCAVPAAGKRSINGIVDWAHTAAIMSAPKLVFDGRGIVDAAGLQAMGLRVEAIGKASLGAM